jgi:hypothetical protein
MFLSPFSDDLQAVSDPFETQVPTEGCHPYESAVNMQRFAQSMGPLKTIMNFMFLLNKSRRKCWIAAFA